MCCWSGLPSPSGLLMCVGFWRLVGALPHPSCPSALPPPFLPLSSTLASLLHPDIDCSCPCACHSVRLESLPTRSLGAALSSTLSTSSALCPSPSQPTAVCMTQSSSPFSFFSLLQLKAIYAPLAVAHKWNRASRKVCRGEADTPVLTFANARGLQPQIKKLLAWKLWWRHHWRIMTHTFSVPVLSLLEEGASCPHACP